MSNSKKAFSILEITMVLVVLAISAGSIFSVFQNKTNTDAYIRAKTKMQKLVTALDAFAILNKRLPCPADITIASASANVTYGTELCSGTGNGGPSSSGVSNGVIFGTIPVKTLRLSDDMMLDEWGNRLIYAVNKKLIDISTGFYTNPTNGFVTLVSGFSPTTTLYSAALVVFSTGANGKNGWTANGTRNGATTSAPGSAEDRNMTPDIADWTGNYYLRNQSNDISTNNDDIVLYQNILQVTSLFGVKRLNAACNSAKQIFYNSSYSTNSADALCVDGKTGCKEMLYSLANKVLDTCVN